MRGITSILLLLLLLRRRWLLMWLRRIARRGLLLLRGVHLLLMRGKVGVVGATGVDGRRHGRRGTALELGARRTEVAVVGRVGVLI